MEKLSPPSQNVNVLRRYHLDIGFSCNICCQTYNTHWSKPLRLTQNPISSHFQRDMTVSFGNSQVWLTSCCVLTEYFNHRHFMNEVLFIFKFVNAFWNDIQWCVQSWVAKTRVNNCVFENKWEIQCPFHGLPLHHRTGADHFQTL